MARSSFIRIVCMLLLLGTIFGCSSVDKRRAILYGGPFGHDEITEDNVESSLRMTLDYKLAALENNIEKYQKEVVPASVGGSTFYYKYYDEFPGRADGLSITITPTDTFSPSHEAEVEYRKVRYQTVLRKSQGRAAADEDFIRDSGIQRDSYELNGNEWRLRSSIFDVIKTSVYREDEWQISVDRIRRVEQEKPELFVDKVRTLFGLLD